MSRQFDQHSDYRADFTSEASGQAPGLLEAAGALERELRGVVHDHLFLAALETRQAGESLVRIIAMGVIAACLLFSAWLALAGAAVVVLVQHSLLTAGSALMLVFAVHSLLVMVLVAVMRKHSKKLLFPATISRLKPATSAESKMADSQMEDSR